MIVGNMRPPSSSRRQVNAPMPRSVPSSFPWWEFRARLAVISKMRCGYFLYLAYQFLHSSILQAHSKPGTGESVPYPTVRHCCYGMSSIGRDDAINIHSTHTDLKTIRRYIDNVLTPGKKKKVPPFSALVKMKLLKFLNAGQT